MMRLDDRKKTNKNCWCYKAGTGDRSGVWSSECAYAAGYKGVGLMRGVASVSSTCAHGS